MTKTELYLGMSVGVDGRVSDDEFALFLKDCVAPSFGGFTVLAGSGQYQADDGSLITESCRVVILLHSGNERIVKEIIRISDCYKIMFGQESVLRVDSQVEMSFI